MTHIVFDKFQTEIDGQGVKPLDYLLSSELCAAFVLWALCGTAVRR